MATSSVLLKLASAMVILGAVVVVYAPPFTVADQQMCEVMNPMVKNLCGPYLMNETATPSEDCCYLMKTISETIPDPDACECYKATMWSIVWYNWWEAYSMAQLCGLTMNYVISRTAICPSPSR